MIFFLCVIIIKIVLNPLEKQKSDYSFNKFTLEFKDLEIESKYIDKFYASRRTIKKKIALIFLIVMIFNHNRFCFKLLILKFCISFFVLLFVRVQATQNQKLIDEESIFFYLIAAFIILRFFQYMLTFFKITHSNEKRLNILVILTLLCNIFIYFLVYFMEIDFFLHFGFGCTFKSRFLHNYSHFMAIYFGCRVFSQFY